MADPNEMVQDLVGKAQTVIATSESEDALLLADMVLEMHDFLQKGGTFPAAWVTHPRQNMERLNTAGGL